MKDSATGKKIQLVILRYRPHIKCMENSAKVIRRQRLGEKNGWQTALDWFVPPIVVPALLIVLGIIRAAYLALQ